MENNAPAYLQTGPPSGGHVIPSAPSFHSLYEGGHAYQPTATGGHSYPGQPRNHVPVVVERPLGYDNKAFSGGQPASAQSPNPYPMGQGAWNFEHAQQFASTGQQAVNYGQAHGHAGPAGSYAAAVEPQKVVYYINAQSPPLPPPPPPVSLPVNVANEENRRGMRERKRNMGKIVCITISALVLLAGIYYGVKFTLRALK